MRTIAVFLILSSLAVTCRAQMGTKYVIVEITDYDDSESYELMTSKEYKELTSLLHRERAYHSRAMALAMRQWEADEQTRDESFPRGAIGRRRARTVGRPFREREDAQEKLAHYETKLAEKLQRDKEREEERHKRRLQLQRRGPRTSYRHRADATRKSIQRDKEREQLKEALAEKALAIYKESLAALLTARDTDTEESKPEQKQAAE